jgi:hypothetical protein
VEERRPAPGVTDDEHRLGKLLMLVFLIEQVVDGETDHLKKFEYDKKREEEQQDTNSP